MKQRQSQSCFLKKIIEVTTASHQNDQMRSRIRDDRKGHPRLLTTRQGPNGLQGQIARDAKAAQVPAQLLRHGRREEGHHKVERGHFEVQLVHVVLRETRHAGVATQFHPAVHGLELPHHEFDQGGFADTVAAHHANAGRNVDAQINAFQQDALRAIAKGQPIDHDNGLLQGLAFGKTKGKLGIVNHVLHLIKDA